MQFGYPEYVLNINVIAPFVGSFPGASLNSQIPDFKALLVPGTVYTAPNKQLLTSASSRLCSYKFTQGSPRLGSWINANECCKKWSIMNLFSIVIVLLFLVFFRTWSQPSVKQLLPLTCPVQGVCHRLVYVWHYPPTWVDMWHTRCYGSSPGTHFWDRTICDVNYVGQIWAIQHEMHRWPLLWLMLAWIKRLTRSTPRDY